MGNLIQRICELDLNRRCFLLPLQKARITRAGLWWRGQAADSRTGSENSKSPGPVRRRRPELVNWIFYWIVRCGFAAVVHMANRCPIFRQKDLEFLSGNLIY